LRCNYRRGVAEQGTISAISDVKDPPPFLKIQVSAHVPNQTNRRTGRTKPLCTVFAVCLIAVGSATAQPAPIAAPDPTGEWLVAKQFARIKIVDCDGHLWGVVAWEAKAGIDTKNPDPNLRTRPTLGMPILLGMAPSKENKWEGQIYNSEDGHTYSASISMADPNTLRVQGCFLGFLCGGENWTRADTADAPTGAAPQKMTAKPPGSGKTTGNRPASADKTAGPQPESNDEICLRVLGPAGLTHERGLK
jgi:uncharacterized protein (DUF2147 family)